MLHQVLDYPPLKPHIWGGKGVGSQGDGTAQFICRSQADQQAVIEILQRDLGMPALKLTITPQQKVRKAVIPAAGFRDAPVPGHQGHQEGACSRSSTGTASPSRPSCSSSRRPWKPASRKSSSSCRRTTWMISTALFTEQISIENYNKLPRQFQEYSRRIVGNRAARHLRGSRPPRKASATPSTAPGRPSGMSRSC